MSLLFEYLSTMSGAGGSGGTIVAIADASITDSNSGSGQSSYTLTSTGNVVTTTTLDGALYIGDWISPTSSAPGSYEVRADVVSGSVTGDTTGAWIALTSSRTWTLTVSDPGYDSALLTISIRLGGTTLTTASVRLSVLASPGGAGA